MSNPGPPDHWLVRGSTRRKLWIGFGLVLVLMLLLQLAIPIEGYFGLDGRFGFAAWYGFGCCVLMVLVAKLLGAVLKRPESYYDD